MHTLCTDTPRQQEVPSFCLRKQGIPISSTSLWSEHCPSYIYLGHTEAAYLHRQGISVILYLDDWLIHHPDRHITVILALKHWIAVLQGHHVMIATENTTVVAYINKQGGTHFHALFRLVVDLFLWLQTQDITISDTFRAASM